MKLFAILSIWAVSIPASTVTLAQPAPGKNASPVPRYTFSDTLEEQEKELADNPLLLRFHDSRAKLLEDPHYPRYHFSSPENRLNDPNGLSYWNGKWHMFYQGYPPEFPRQHWGHVISDDLIHWRDLPYAIYPDPERACFSGNVIIEEDRAIAMYHGTEVGSMVAVSSDPLLLNWEKVTGQAVIPEWRAGPPPLPHRIFDPAIFREGDYYYALTAGQTADGPGGKSVRAVYLHRSSDLANWQYIHQFLENDRYGMVGDDGACPYFWPIGPNDEKHILIHYSHTSGGKWILGDLDRERMKFEVTDGGDFNHGPSRPGGVHAPSVFPDGNGGLIVIFNMNDAYPTEGWNQLMSLPRRLTLAPNDPWDPIRQEPAGDYASLRGKHESVRNLNLPANEDVVLENISGNTMEIIAEIDPKSSPAIELELLRSPGGEEKTRIIIQLEKGYSPRTFGLNDMRARRAVGEVMYDTVVTLDNTRSSILPQAESRPMEMDGFKRGKGQPLNLHIFIDRSVVEVFVNGKACVAARVYPGRKDSLGVALRSQGGEAILTALDAWQMGSIY
ncbi:MAG: glycosyl hydrolase family 32 domain protein [Opitutae bacterium]|nr:glycosyl hydrolase family 32 domain protein [Opitutae bacterium]